MYVNQLKDKLMKRKNPFEVQKILFEILLTYLKEKAPLYVDGSGLTKDKQNKKEDTYMTYFTKTEYWKPLVPNAESVDKTTNPSFKNPRAPYDAENEAEFVLVKKTCFSIPVFTETYKNIKKFVSGILKRTRSVKPDTEEASHIARFSNPNIKKKYNLTPKKFTIRLC